MEQDLLLDEDVLAVVQAAEGPGGQKLLDPATGRFVAHLKVNGVTVWAEYQEAAGAGGAANAACGQAAFVVWNVYSHRMALEGE
jgi:hypothetical protein